MKKLKWIKIHNELYFADTPLFDVSLRLINDVWWIDAEYKIFGEKPIVRVFLGGASDDFGGLKSVKKTAKRVVREHLTKILESLSEAERFLYDG